MLVASVLSILEDREIAMITQRDAGHSPEPFGPSEGARHLPHYHSTHSWSREPRTAARLPIICGGASVGCEGVGVVSRSEAAAKRCAFGIQANPGPSSAAPRSHPAATRKEGSGVQEKARAAPPSRPDPESFRAGASGFLS